MGLFDDNKYVNAMKEKFNGAAKVKVDWEKFVRSEMEGLNDEDREIVDTAIKEGSVGSRNYLKTIERIKELKSQALVEE